MAAAMSLLEVQIDGLHPAYGIRISADGPKKLFYWALLVILTV